MRISRSYVDMALAVGSRVQLPERSAHHLIRVLRLSAGDQVTLFNGRDGIDYNARIACIKKRDVQADVLGPRAPAEEIPPLSIHLALGVSRSERMDFAIQKATELGVTSITPLATDRSLNRQNEARRNKKQGHWQGVVISACEQSGRCRLPTLHDTLPFHEWATQVPPSTLLLDNLAKAALPDLPPPGASITIAVGPEGGFSEAEKQELKRAGAQAVRLGPRVLRTETAPLAAISVIQACWGDFR